MMNFDFYNPTHLLFGRGKLNELGHQLLPGKKAMVLISNGNSTKANGSLSRTLDQLEKAGVEHVVFDKIMENPVKEVIMEGAAFAKDNGCDFIVALGGGAVLDASVAISAMATNPGDLWDYVCGGTGKENSSSIWAYLLSLSPQLPEPAQKSTAGALFLTWRPMKKLASAIHGLFPFYLSSIRNLC